MAPGTCAHDATQRAHDPDTPDTDISSIATATENHA